MNKLLVASLLMLSACAGNKEATQTEIVTTDTTATVAAKAYACPMHCEGEKTYTAAGKCPVCKMDLQEVAMNEPDSVRFSH